MGGELRKGKEPRPITSLSKSSFGSTGFCPDVVLSFRLSVSFISGSRHVDKGLNLKY